VRPGPAGYRATTHKTCGLGGRPQARLRVSSTWRGKWLSRWCSSSRAWSKPASEVSECTSALRAGAPLAGALMRRQRVSVPAQQPGAGRARRCPSHSPRRPLASRVRPSHATRRSSERLSCSAAAPRGRGGAAAPAGPAGCPSIALSSACLLPEALPQKSQQILVGAGPATSEALARHPARWLSRSCFGFEGLQIFLRALSRLCHR